MNTIIVGGGWSGLAAAVTLTQQGKPVTLLEAAPQLGGRARSLDWRHIQIDNGQHLLIGAYQRVLSLLQQIGGEQSELFVRCPLDLTIYDNEFPPLSLSSNNRFPWPLSLAYSLWRSIGWQALKQVFRLQRQIPVLLKQADRSLQQWLLETGQSPRLIKQLWEPLCLGALNTPVNEASAHIFAMVIQQSLLQDEHSADLLLPKQTLTDIFPNLAARFIKQQGGNIHLQQRVKALNIHNNQIKGLMLNDGTLIEADNIIIATAVNELIRLTSPVLSWQPAPHYPICTIYLQYPSPYKLPKPIVGSSGTMTQWLFDRSDLEPGLIAAVISGPGAHEALKKTELVQQVCAEIQSLFPDFPNHVDHSRVIREKRATFASSSNINQRRPPFTTSVKGLWLAGDYVSNQLPATLEGAVSNGIDCANLLLEVDNKR